MATYPDNWDSMGAKARHTYSVAQSKAKNTKAVKPTAANPQPQNGSSLPELYGYYSEMIKGHANGLKQVPDHKERNVIKASYLNTYRDYLAEYRTAGETHDNNVLFYCLVWACDCEQWDYALELVDYAVKTVQHTDIFDRDPQTVFADQVFKFAEQAYKDSKPKAFEDCQFLAVFDRVISDGWAINDILKARYYKLKGLIIQESQPQIALDYFVTALKLKPDIGVKQRIEELKKQLAVS